MTLTIEQRALYETRLAAAETAYHDLTIGGQARVYVDQSGERVEYFSASSARLKAYILELKSVLGQNLGILGPMNVWIVR